MVETPWTFELRRKQKDKGEEIWHWSWPPYISLLSFTVSVPCHPVFHSPDATTSRRSCYLPTPSLPWHWAAVYKNGSVNGSHSRRVTSRYYSLHSRGRRVTSRYYSLRTAYVRSRSNSGSFWQFLLSVSHSICQHLYPPRLSAPPVHGKCLCIFVTLTRQAEGLLCADLSCLLSTEFGALWHGFW